MYVESTPEVPAPAAGHVSAAVVANTTLVEKTAAKTLEDIPGDRGLTIGPFGRGARRR
jgi:hypothetical protein